MGFEAIADYFRRKPQGQREPWDEKIVIDGVPTHMTNIGLPRWMRELVNQYPNVGVGSDNEDDSSNVFAPISPLTRYQNPDVITPPNPPAGAETIGAIRPKTVTPQSTSIETRPNADGVFEAISTPPSTAIATRPQFSDVSLQPLPIEARTAQAGRNANTFDPVRDYDSTQSAIRPRWTSPMNQELTRNALTRDAYEHPDKAHGWRRFAPVLEGFAGGVQSTGSLAGGIGGAVTGLGISAFDPKAGNRLKYGRELAESDQRLGIMQKQRGAALDEQGKIADIEFKRSQTYKNHHPEAKEPKTFQGADGLQYTLSSDGKTATAIQGQGKKPAQSKVLRTVNRGGKVWYETEDGLRPATDPKTGKQLSDDLVPVRLPNGVVVRVSPATAVNAVATGGRSAQNAQNAAAWREYTTEKGRIDKENQRTEKEYTEAQQAAEAYNNKHDELDKFYAALQTTEKEADKAYYQNQINNLHAQLQTLGNSLRDKYAKQGYIRYSNEERWIAGERPEPKDYPDAPELSFSEGPEVVSEEDRTEAPQPTSANRPRRTRGNRPRVAPRVSKKALADLTQ